MRFNILFVDAFVCVCAGACSDDGLRAYGFAVCVFSCVKGVHEFIKSIAPVKGKLDYVLNLLLEEKEQQAPRLIWFLGLKCIFFQTSSS